MPLDQYRSKRQFAETPEPAGNEGHSGSPPFRPLVFVVQKHAASHLHYDFRLEMEGVLKSWAVPKGPSLNPADKRLAMMVEDHPFDYRTFEGTIPGGNYGAGTVMVWDQGTYHAVGTDDPRESERRLLDGLNKGHLSFVLEGEKLNGEFSLVKMHGREENSWLLVKKQDRFANTRDVRELDRSAQTGRTMEEIAAEEGHGTDSEPPASTDLGRKASMPRAVKPMLAALTDEPFSRPGWIFEIKWDGFRAIAELEKGKPRLYSRKSQNLGELFRPVADALRGLPYDAVLDGEIVVVDESGASRFELIQQYRRTGKGTLAYYVFDLIYYNGRDLMRVPLLERRELLARIIRPSPTVKLSEHVTEGTALFEAAREKGLEGIIAKDGSSIYQPGVRSDSWLKIKTRRQQDAVIGGFTRPRGSRKKFGALVLGVYEGDDLVYIGHTGGGLTNEELDEVYRRMEPLVTDRSPFKVKPKTNTPATWVKPDLVCEVLFHEWTPEGYMRQPIFLGLREDKKPREVTREIPVPAPAPPSPGLKLLAETGPHKKGRSRPKEATRPVRLLSTPSSARPTHAEKRGNESAGLKLIPPSAGPSQSDGHSGQARPSRLKLLP
ncbi:MAG: non-homologous end-joining DNA ligase, partial [Rudaea sp.]